MSCAGCINYIDTVTLVTTTVNEYATEVVDEQIDVPAVVQLNTGYVHSANQDAVTSDAVVYIDPSDAFVSANHNRLEEMLLITCLYDTALTEDWYKITNVDVIRGHQLRSRIDNIRLDLKKTTQIANVS